MRRLFLIGIALLASGCARPSAGYSFHDLVWAASDGMREYEEWVANDNRPEDRFPNILCLAGIRFTASLAETKSRSADVGLPLAAPALGLTGMLGYEFVSTESQSGAITASLLARYPIEADVTEQKGEEDLAAWGRQNLERLYEDRNIDKYERGAIRPPPSLTIAETEAFKSRTDLASELWRIREALHTAVLNSPQGTDGYVLIPGPMTLKVSYTLSTAQGAKLSVQMAAQPASGTGFAGSGVTEANTMHLVYVENNRKDKMSCRRDSIEEMAFKTAVMNAVGAVAAPSIPPTKLQ